LGTNIRLHDVIAALQILNLFVTMQIRVGPL
jgi:hypothetical protein